MLIQNLPLIIESVIYVIALIVLLYEFWLTKNRPILFLVGAILVFLLMTLLDLLFPVIVTTDSFSATLFGLELIIAGTLFALVCLILFFDSFHSPTILNLRNVFLFVVVISNETAVLISYVSSVTLLDLPADADTTASENSILIFLTISTLVAFVLVILLTIYLFLLLRRKIREADNLQIERLFKRIRNGGLVIVFGPFILTVLFGLLVSDIGIDLSFLDSISTLIGLALIFSAVHEGGIYLLQGTNLKKLMVISEHGVPVYGYSFHSLSKERDLNEVESEVLFSGAFKAITTLMGEFTGSSHQVRQIILEDMAISARSILGGRFSVLLITDFVSPFTTDALESFVLQSKFLFEELDQPTMSVDQIKVANSLVETSFGFRNIQVLTSQY